ncbi:ATP synthase F1 subunit epsilon [Methylococcus sp. EFPC2]|uniref:ATP synthase F1 subunit epsilon n=1 Tax=Methylococcus sp. EFPC2 TaxID=2812648 RepID=UPI001967C967|nr:ATP synthase F1 subunit epsilon [Methylococcus sp. EFPC2]QSA96755.1 ATP synthase F1 subunit epsilon [Methylococcus sp. EFPC2]
MTEHTPALLRVDIADVTQQIFSGLCRSVVAPASLGEVCILPRHAPLLSKLIPGTIKLDTGNGEPALFYVSGGYLEVQRTEVTILADHMLRSDQLDRESALEAKRRAEEVLKKARLFTDRDQAKLELIKALAQLRVLERVDLLRLHGKRPRSR